MFSILIIGKTFLLNSSSLNSLLGSAFLLLLINPYNLMQIGFQLSYLAVLGLILFYPPIIKLWKPKYFIMRAIWPMIVVSFIAQLSTFPLGLYYFHQFPLYFLPANLLIVTPSSIIVIIGVVYFLFFPFHLLDSIMGYLLSISINWLNQTVIWFENLPYSYLKTGEISIFETILIYLLIIGIIYLFILRKQPNRNKKPPSWEPSGF